jgi:hypothetical protein
MPTQRRLFSITDFLVVFERCQVLQASAYNREVTAHDWAAREK